MIYDLFNVSNFLNFLTFGLFLISIFYYFIKENKSVPIVSYPSYSKSGFCSWILSPFIGHSLEFWLNPKQVLVRGKEEHGDIFGLKLGINSTMVIVNSNLKKKYFSSLTRDKNNYGDAMQEGLRRVINAENTDLYDGLFNSWHFSCLHLMIGKSKVENNTYAVLNDCIDQQFKDLSFYDDLKILAWDIITRMSARSFVGPEIGNNEKLINVFKKFHKTVARVLDLSQFIPDLFIKGWLFFSGNLRKDYKDMEEVIIPEVIKRRKGQWKPNIGALVKLRPEIKEKNGLKTDDIVIVTQIRDDGNISVKHPESNKDLYWFTSEDFNPNDLLQYLIQKKDKNFHSAEEISKYMLSLVFASMATTAGFTNHCLCDLAGRPEMQDWLFEEQQNIIKKYPNKSRSKIALDKCHRLGAFIWESMRLSALPFQQARGLLSDHIIDDMKIKKGTMVMMSGILNSRIEMDGDGPGFIDANNFNPKRFLNESGELISPEIAEKMGFFPFGVGRHICPGRFFAISEIKLVLIGLLQKYKIRTENGKPPDYDYQAVSVDRKPLRVYFEVKK